MTSRETPDPAASILAAESAAAMSEIRRSFSGALESAGTVLDPGERVKAHPLASLAVAAVAGFVAAPGRKPRRDSATPAGDPPAREPNAKPPRAVRVATLLGLAILRSALRFAGAAVAKSAPEEAPPPPDPVV